MVAHSETLLAPAQRARPGGALSRWQVVRSCWSLWLCSMLASIDNYRGEKHDDSSSLEARPKGRREGTAIVDYVVEEQGDRVLKAFKTQAEAITWAKSGPT